MPSIYSVTKSGIVGVNLDGTAWMLHLKETTEKVNANTTHYHFGIVFAYPPAELQLLNFSVMTLMRAHMAVALEPNEIQQVAKVALDGGSLEKDKERTAEAFELFKNRPRIKQAALEADIESAQKIIEVYWQIQEWISGGMSEEKEITEMDTKLILRP